MPKGENVGGAAFPSVAGKLTQKEGGEPSLGYNPAVSGLSSSYPNPRIAVQESYG
jgi:hypothetical protein